jgi:uncharacterized membrane protein
MIRTLCLALFALPVAALADIPPLGNEAAITEGLIATAIAYEIGKECDGVDARILRGLAYLNSLRDEARRLGYSNQEIDAYIDDEEAKDRIEALARERFAALGGVEGDAESYCAVGRAEIAKGSQIGQLLND